MRYALIAALSLLFVGSQAVAASPCLEKKQSIEREIGYAQQHHNQHRIDGLKKALSEVQNHCSDDSLRAEHRKDIARQRTKVAERKQELSEARAKGNAEKITQKRQKLTEAERDLNALEARDY